METKSKKCISYRVHLLNAADKLALTISSCTSMYNVLVGVGFIEGSQECFKLNGYNKIDTGNTKKYELN